MKNRGIWTPKIGEAVVCIVDYSNQFTKGKIYIVKEINQKNWVRLVDNNNVMNGWALKYFKPASKVAQILFGVNNESKQD